MKKFQLAAVYQNRSIKVMFSEFSNPDQISRQTMTLKAQGIPYAILQNFEKIIKIEPSGMRKDEIAQLVEEYIN